MLTNTLNALMIPAINATPTQPPGMENVTMILGWILWAAGLVLFVLHLRARHRRPEPPPRR